MPHFPYTCRLTPLFETFGEISRFLLRKIMSAEGDAVHFVTDKWLSPSIKDSERDSRGSSSALYKITGPSQRRPSNWTSALRNNSFKESLVEFLINIWESYDLARIYQNKTLIANSSNICYSYRVVDVGVYRNVEVALYSDHEESDSRMFYQLANVRGPNK